MLTISHATENDIAGILHILNHHLITNQTSLSQEQLEQKGFFISPFTEEDLRKILANKEKNILLVAKENDRVCGYMLGHDLRYKSPKWLGDLEASSDIKALLESQKIFYHRHIGAVKIANGAEVTDGVGRSLMNFMLEEVKKREYDYIVCQIIIAPLKNQKSLAFHECFGFEQYGSGPEENGMTYGLYLKKL